MSATKKESRAVGRIGVFEVWDYYENDKYFGRFSKDSLTKKYAIHGRNTDPPKYSEEDYCFEIVREAQEALASYQG